MATFTLIASNTLGSNASSVTFNSIPQTYKDLVLMCGARTNNSGANDYLAIQFNGNTNSIYNGNQAYTSDSSVIASTGGNLNVAFDQGNIVARCAGDGATANVISSNKFYIPNYTKAYKKAYFTEGGLMQNGTGNFVGFISNMFNSTDAITSILLKPYGTGQFLTNSSFFLYGI